MRMLLVAFLVLIGVPIDASAGPRTGTDSSREGGRLARVSSGIARATTRGSLSARSRGSSVSPDLVEVCPAGQYRRRVFDDRCVRRCPRGHHYDGAARSCVRRVVAVVGLSDAAPFVDATSTVAPPQGIARVSAYAGAQKVFESDGALALELAVADRWFRVGGALTRLYEQQPDGSTLTLTMPSVAFGVRIDDSPTTRVYVEAGIVGAVTRNDPMVDSSIHGALGGVHAEHSLSERTSLIGTARMMQFEDGIRAASVRAGVRYRHVQASFRVLDFNVGPALFGPEIGVGF